MAEVPQLVHTRMTDVSKNLSCFVQKPASASLDWFCWVAPTILSVGNKILAHCDRLGVARRAAGISFSVDPRLIGQHKVDPHTS